MTRRSERDVKWFSVGYEARDSGGERESGRARVPLVPVKGILGDGGIQECGYAQNCVEVCPKDIPLTKAISEVGGEVMKQALSDLFRR